MNPAGNLLGYFRVIKVAVQFVWIGALLSLPECINSPVNVRDAFYIPSFQHRFEIIPYNCIVTYEIILGCDVDPVLDNVARILPVLSLTGIIKILADTWLPQRITQCEPLAYPVTGSPDITILTHLGKFPENIIADDAPHAVRDQAHIISSNQ